MDFLLTYYSVESFHFQNPDNLTISADGHVLCPQCNILISVGKVGLPNYYEHHKGSAYIDVPCFLAPSTFLWAYSKPCWDWRRVCWKSWCWYPCGFRPFGSNCWHAWDGCRSPSHQWGPRQLEAMQKAPNYLIWVRLQGKYLGKWSWAGWGPCRMQQSWLWNLMGKSSASVLKTSCTHHPLQFHMECVHLEFRVQNWVCELCVVSDSHRKDETGAIIQIISSRLLWKSLSDKTGFVFDNLSMFILFPCKNPSATYCFLFFR